MGPSPLVDFFRRGEAARDVRLLAAEGAFAPRAQDQLAILVLLLDDPDPEIRAIAERTLNRIPREALSAFLARSDTPTSLRDFFAARGIAPAPPPAGAPAAESEDPLIDTGADDDAELLGASPAGADDDDLLGDGGEDGKRDSVTQQLAKMSFSQRLKAAVKGSREMRAILVRDPNKMICTAVMSSPKLTEQEVEGIARMANVAEDVLRIIGSNRAWMKNYSIALGLAKNPKTPLAMSMNLIHRLSDRDLAMLSIDRNVPEVLRVTARKKVVANRT